MGTTPLVERLQGFGTTIFAEMSALATAHDAINLGQGFPDTDGPTVMADTAIAAIREGRNQYPPGPGIPALRAAIARHQRRFWGLEVDPDHEVLVTVGATEAIAATVLALCEPGDEVVTFEPYYDSYAATIAMAGAVRRPVTLRPPDFLPDLDEVAAAIGPATKVLLVNTPHNPTGTVFDRPTLEALAALAIEHDLTVVTDEVYEHIVFDDHEHIPMATLPGMAGRTVTISSAGKTFSFTGWKVGWVCGPEPLVSAVRTAKQFLTYAHAAPFQEAVAVGLDLPDDHYRDLASGLQERRDRIVGGLRSAGFDVFPPSGTYFVTVDISPVAGDVSGREFCRSLPAEAGVAAVPVSVFYDDQEVGRPLVRFAFCKRPEVLDDAATRLTAWGDR